MLVAFLQPLTDREGVDALAKRGVTAFALESIPRITRAQSMDALSSQSTVAGYKAVLLAAARLPRFFPMLMTAAGTVTPRRCSSSAPAWRAPGDRDGPPARRGRVRLRHAAGREGAGREPRRDVRRPRRDGRGDRRRLRGRADRGAARHQQEELARRIGDSDVVVTTALVPGQARAAS